MNTIFRYVGMGMCTCAIQSDLLQALGHLLLYHFLLVEFGVGIPTMLLLESSGRQWDLSPLLEAAQAVPAKLHPSKGHPLDTPWGHGVLQRPW